VRDLACVPTGITKYREGLYPIPDVDKAYSEKLLDLVDSLNKEFGVDFLLPADEYFVKAERDFKDAAFYGDFEQIENGIGMTTKFLSEANSALAALIEENEGGRYALKKPKRSVVVCGTSAEKVNTMLAEKCMAAIEGLQMDVLPVVNDFFGPTVTCTGLLTGKDILAALQKYCKETGDFDEVILAGNTMKEFEDVFLCGMTLKELKKKFVFENIKINREGGYGLIEIVAADK
jgi:NifB/MoaA-like Fe-S oxidoreductase